MSRRKILPPTYFYAAIGLMIALAVLLPGARVLPVPWNFLGLVPLFAGVGFAFWAEREFKHYGTTVIPFEPSSVLVTTGAFQYTRNPMYVGFILALTGIALLLRSLTPFVVIPVFAVLITAVFIRAEEHMLQEEFGQEFQEYRQKVRRWI